MAQPLYCFFFRKPFPAKLDYLCEFFRNFEMLNHFGIHLILY